MTNTTLNVLSQPDETGTDVLTALLRNGARQLIAQAVEADWRQFDGFNFRFESIE